MKETETPVIETVKLSKKYPGTDKPALDNVSLKIYAGEVYGFLGPNGAGKSTTIRLLMNFLKPTGGSATIFGKDAQTEDVEIKHSVGYLSGDFAVYPKMTGEQYLTYLDELQGGGNINYAHKLAKDYKADLKKKLGDLSRGNKQKIGLIQAVMHQPKLLILDEPTSGLDPIMQEKFYKLVNDNKQRGATIFISSHILGEVQRICDRVSIIREGKIVAERVIAELAKEASQTFDINFSKTAPISELKKIKGLKIQNHNQNSVTIHMNGRLSDLFKVLAQNDVEKIDARNLDLEEMFIHFYQGKDGKL